MTSVRFTLNGRPAAIEPAPGESLLEALRERCGIISIKDGCQPQGQCGCCLALIDGRPLVTCAFEAGRAEGREVLTLEGVAPREREIVSKALAAAGGVQCGFCIPGIALRAKHLLDRKPDPSRDEIARAIDGHLCRCTGYAKIVDAIELMAQAGAAARCRRRSTMAASGSRSPATALSARPSASGPTWPTCSARACLHGALVLSPHARARVVRIDTSKAAALPGVRAVVTAADVPGERWYGLLYDDWPGFVAEGEEVRCVGDVLAAVAADDERTARAAAALVEVEYEPLPPVLDPEAALAPGAPQVNPKHQNLLSRSVIRRGDAEAALAASAHVVTGTWQTQRIEHLYLEPESALAEPLPDGRLHLYTQGQGIFDDRRQVARFLGVPEEHILVELVPNGGAFGGKEDMSVQAQTALLARVTGRPVKLILTREESVRLHPKRHPITLDYTVGCDAEGRLTAVEARIVGDSGAYASVGRQGARARGRPRLRPVQGRRGRRRGAGRLHEQPALRRHARLRRQAGALRDRGLPRPAREEGGPRRLGDPLAQRAGRRRRLHHRPGAREVGRHPQDARRGEGRLLRRPQRAGRRSASPAASRTAASATASPSGASAGSSWRRTAPSRSTTATPRWARAC